MLAVTAGVQDPDEGNGTWEMTEYCGPLDIEKDRVCSK
jgi:hypothetical protein